MKKHLPWFALGVAVTLLLGATFRQTHNYVIENYETTQPKLEIRSSGLATNSIQVLDGTDIKFAVPATGLLPLSYGGTGTNSAAGAKQALGIQSGTAVTVGSGDVTNTFAVAFSSAPVVIVSGPTNALAHVSTITTTNVKLGAAASGVTLQWIAIGAP